MIGKFLKYAKNHRIQTRPLTRIIGIRGIIIGWSLIALGESVFQVPKSSAPLIEKYWIVFAAATLSLFISGLLKNKSYFRLKKTEKDRVDKAHFTPAYRFTLLWIRGFLATGGFMLFILSRIIIGAIDNSALFGADAFIYAILMATVLKERVKALQWIGIAIVSSGILWLFFVDMSVVSISTTLLGIVCGLLSSLALAVVTLMTSPMVQHDQPLKIAFYQCLSGLILCTLIIIIYIIFEPKLIESWKFSISNIINYSLVGCFYAIALIFFLDAFKYTEPLIIATLSYTLLPITIFFNFFIINIHPEILDIFISIVITIGCGFLIHYEYRLDKSKKRLTISQTTYDISPKEDFNLIKEEYLLNKIDKYHYMDLRHQYNKILFEYIHELNSTKIEKMEIDNKKILFYVRGTNLKMESDGGCRSAPLEMLNFGEYEDNETKTVLKLLRNGDTILDVGAHVGWYTLNICNNFPNSTVHCFEPVPVTNKFLRKNLVHNNINNAVVHNFGLYDRNEQIDFHYSRGTSALASPVDLIQHHAPKIQCEVKKMDDVFKNKLIKKLSFIKLDIEGCELAAIKGGENTIKKYKPMIMVELVNKWSEEFGYNSNDVLKLLSKMEYNCFQIGKKDIKEVHHIDESDVNEYYNYLFINPKNYSDRVWF